MVSIMKLLIISLLCVLTCVQTIHKTVRDDKEYKVVCFWGSWAYYRSGDGKFTPEDMDPNICTHLIYGFAKINENHEITSFDPYLDIVDHNNNGIGCYKKFNSIRKLNPSLNTMIALGDMNDRRYKYIEMIGTEETRKKFIKSVKKFLEEYDFDGLELTWEYPGFDYHDFSETNYKNLMLLLKELHEELSLNGYLLSISLSVNEKNINENTYDISSIEKYVDFINLFTFDFHLPTKQDLKTGPNAPLDNNSNDSEHDKKFTIHYAVDHWLKSTKNSTKLILGIPAFGHSFKLVSSEKHDWKSPIKGSGISGKITKSPGVLGYNEICELLNKEPGQWKIVADPYYKVPYMWKDDQFISFDDPISIRYKLDFLKEKQLGGAMIWTIDTDDFKGKCSPQKFTLTSTVMKELNTNNIGIK